jgi:hypothetical protein
MFKKYLPILLSLIVVAVVAFLLVSKKNSQESMVEKKENMGAFKKQRSCARHPQFLSKLKVSQPITIDLSQQQFKGLAFLYGKNFSKVIHPKQWEVFEHFSTYALDKKGDMFLAPMPFISIKPTTFNLQKNIYKLDSLTGKISIFMHFNDVFPSASNPYGIISLVHDCDDETLWVSAIDESSYREQKGVIYHIDIKTKQILQKVEGTDALTLRLLRSEHGKFLLAGSARENALYAFLVKQAKITNSKIKLLELPSANERIRKIKIRNDNTLELQTIPFSYTLIAETSNKNERKEYKVEWNSKLSKFKFLDES